MADSNIAGLPAGAAIADTDLIAGSDAGSGTLVKKTGLQFNTYIRQMLAALPSSDPHVAGALWNNGGLVAISFPFVRSLAGTSGAYALTGSAATFILGGPPTFQVDFTAISVLPAQVTLSRASAGTYFDSSGVMQTAAIDAPRFDYDPATLAARGLLIEESRTNVVFFSRTFDAFSWNHSGVTPTANATTSPDGTANATKFTESATTAEHRLYLNPSATTAVSTVWSLFAKKAQRSWVSIRNAGGSVVANYDLNAGVVGTTAGANFISASIIPLNNGWYRCIMIATAGSSGDFITINLGDADTGTGAGYSYAGDGTSGLYLWDSGVEAGAYPTSDIPTTTTSAVTRSADVALLTGTATTALEGSAASAILEAQLFATTPAGNEVLFGKSPTAYSMVKTATTLSFFSGGSDLTATFGSGNISSAFRTAISFDGGTRNIVINGGTLVSGATVAAVTGDVPLGGYASGAQIATGWYRKMAIYNTRMIDATLTTKSVVGAAF